MGRQKDEVKTMGIALLNLSDDEGYFYADPSTIRSFARPFDDDSKITLGCLQQLIKIDYLEIRQHPVRGFIGRVLSFLEHQRVDKPKPSVIKKFCDAAVPVIVLGLIQEPSEINPAGKEGNGKEEDQKIPASPKARGTSNASQVAKAQADSRHNRSQQLLMGWYRDWAGIECPWDGGEARQLSGLLKAWPGVSDAQFVTCLEHIEKSDCIPKGDRPREWLGKLPKFLHGPLDQFWKAKQGNGNGQVSKDAARNAGNKAAIIRGLTGQGPSGDPVHGGPGVPERDHGGNDGVLEIVPNRARAAVAGTDS